MKYIEKKPNLTILTGLKSKNIRFSTMVAIKWYEIATLTPVHLFAVKGGEKRGWPNHAIHLRCVWKNGIRSNIRSSRKVVLREACNLIKKWLQHKCFLGNFAEFLRTCKSNNFWSLRLFLSLFQWIIPLNHNARKKFGCSFCPIRSVARTPVKI